MKKIEKLLNSLDNNKDGWSARKLTAFYSVVIASSYLTYLIPEKDRLYALVFWQLLALLCLGIVTFEQIIKLKNNGNNIKQNDTNE